MTRDKTDRPSSGPGAKGVLAQARYVGEVLGETYRITRKIGSGGMADVYEVEHLRLGGRFAAKVARTGGPDDGSLRRFLKEAKLLASLSSDHIVKVFDLSRPGDSVPYYVMELLEGRDLRQIIVQAPKLSVSRAVSIVLDACRGVSVMHAAGLVHRDLKPENLFVTNRDSGLELTKLLDFGVVKGEEGNSTEHGALVGTVKYMAPEQIEQCGAVGPRSDVYSLGAILYECLSGRPPHVADTLERLLYKILNDTPLPLRSFRAELPPTLDAVVMRALERNASDRYPGAHAFADALREFAIPPFGHDVTIPPGALKIPPGLSRARGPQRRACVRPCSRSRALPQRAAPCSLSHPTRRRSARARRPERRHPAPSRPPSGPPPSNAPSKPRPSARFRKLPTFRSPLLR
jgi:eukaryotic-like serine/threonine-protein kinase